MPIRLSYLVYILIFSVVGCGYVGVHPLIVIMCAILSACILTSERSKQLSEERKTGAKNRFVDGAYLACGQTLIMFMAYIIGYFLANRIAIPS